MALKACFLLFTALVCEVRLQAIEIFNPGPFAPCLPQPVQPCLPETPVTLPFPQNLIYQPGVSIQSSTVVDVDATISLPFQPSPFNFISQPPLAVNVPRPIPIFNPPQVNIPPPTPIFNPSQVNILPPSIPLSPPLVPLPPNEQFPPSLSFPVPKPVAQPINFPPPPISVQPPQINLPQIPSFVPSALPLPSQSPVSVFPPSVFPAPSISLLPPQPQPPVIELPVSLPQPLLAPIYTPPPIVLPTLLPSPTITLPPVIPTTSLVSTNNNSLTNTLATILQLLLTTKLARAQQLYSTATDIASLYSVIGNIGPPGVYTPQNTKYPQYSDCYGYEVATPVATPVNYGYVEVAPPVQDLYGNAYGLAEYPVVGVADNGLPVYTGYYLSYD